MPLLPPTVAERLARCGTRVLVTGLAASAEVTVSVGADDHTFTATSGSRTLIVPPLAAGVEVTARQQDAGGPSGSSAPVVVEEVALPPQARPELPGQVGMCAECIHVGGLVPGCDVEVFVLGAPAGEGVANRHGSACVKVDFELQGERGTLEARMIVCGDAGPLASTEIVGEGPLTAPTVAGPLYACQRMVPLRDVRPGANYRLESDVDGGLGSFCNCWHAVNVFIGPELVAGHRISAQGFWSSNRCQADGPPSDGRLVVEPDEGITPELLAPLVDGDMHIRVDNQIAGSDLHVIVRDGPGQPEVEFGPRPANADPTDLVIALGDRLEEGQQVKVRQTLCTRDEESDWVTVIGPPPEVLAPVVLGPLYECAGRVQVHNLHPGATVRVFQDGIVVGLDWAGMDSSRSVDLAPGLVAGGEVHAVQWVGGVESPPSQPPVVVQSLEEMPPPSIVEPVALGDHRVWVSGVVPGARVSIRTGDVLLGEAYAAEPIVVVPTAAVTGPVRATAALCARAATSDPVDPITDPLAPGIFPASASDARDYGTFTVPAVADGGDFDHPITGRLYYPADTGGRMHEEAFDLPLVVIAHGYWDPDQNSYLGYGYLAHHLARWGAVVFSINLDVVNTRTGSAPFTQQSARGEIILEAARRVISDPDLQNRIDPGRVGLVGHSMSGEGVVAAQVSNVAAGSPLGIQGVVSIAPTNWRPDLFLRSTKYLQVYGSRDQLVSALFGVTGADPPYGGFRIFDRAERPKTHAWVYEARHNGFNTEWFNGLNNFETHLVDVTLGLGEHQVIAKALINSFFQDALHGATDYAGYLRGPVLPQGLSGFDVYTQHLAPGPTVIDDFGDAEPQLGLPAQPLDKSTNRISLAVNATGGGLDTWEDRELVDLAHSVHDTRGVELAWSGIDVVYRSATGGVAVSPASWISLRVAQFYEDAAANFPGQDLDVLVGLSDGIHTALVRLGLVAVAPYPDALTDPLIVLRTGRLPVDTFRAVDQSLNLSNIQEVAVFALAKGTGHLLMDSIELQS